MDKAIRVTCGILAGILVFLSIFASAGYIINESNKVQNKQIQGSTEYKQLEDGRALKKDLYFTKKDELKRLQDLQQSIKADGEKAIESLPKNYITVRNNTFKETQAKIEQIQGQINTVQQELSSINSELQQNIDVSNISFKSESGYMALFEMLANLINKTESLKDDPISADNLSLYFFIFVSAIFEVVAITLYVIKRKVLSVIAFIISFCFTFFLMTSMSAGLVAYILAGGMSFILDMSKCLLMDYSLKERLSKGLETLNYTNEKPNNIKLNNKPRFAIANKNTIGFKSDTLNNSDIERYKGYMYETQKDGISKGYMNIAKNIGMNIEVARKVKAHLEHSGIIETVGSRTIIKN